MYFIRFFQILNTHVNYKRLPDEAKELGCKTVFVLRNPKDLVVSLYNHVKGIPSYEYDGEWKHFLPLFLEGKSMQIFHRQLLVL